MTENIYMKRALELAKIGTRAVYPNPMVGCVIVKDNKIIGEGYHEVYGEAHAEVNAIKNVFNQNDLKESTLYVTLEPCSHYGKTPPCSDLIIQKEIPKVVIACKDIFAKVDGRGIKRLKNAGINVEVGLLEKQAVELNKRFFTFHSEKRPFICLKWAETRDGFIDKKRKEEATGVNWITAPETQTLVHSLRAKEHGILVGVQTIINDDPLLNVRKLKAPSPLRIILDPNCRIPHKSKVIQDGQKTMLICKENKYKIKPISCEVIEIPDFNLHLILNKLHQKGILSIFVEGGAATLNHFIEENLWDEAHQFIGCSYFEGGLKAPKLTNAPLYSSKELGKDIYRIYKTNK